MIIYRKIKPALLALTLVTLGGCAGVTFYSDDKLTIKTGIPIYAPKPYLLVARTGAKDKPVDISIVYLSDPNKVIYAKPRSGFGSSNLTLALANGQMTSFGQQTDTKLPELITSLGGLITARAGASKAEAEAEKILSDLGTQQAASSMVELGGKVSTVAQDMQKRLDAGALAKLTELEQQKIKSAIQALGNAGRELSNAANVASASSEIDKIKETIKGLEEIPANVGNPDRDAAYSFVHSWVGELKAIVGDAEPPQPPPSTFELYEIIQGKGEPASLKRVNP